VINVTFEYKKRYRESRAMSNLRLSFSGVCGSFFGVFVLAVLFLGLNPHSAGAAWPATSSFKSPDKVIGKMETFVDESAVSGKKVAYGLGGLGTVAMSALAFFGRFNWNWLWGLMGGLMLVGLYGTGVTAFTGETF
jgi:hypothetical protein